MGYGALSRRPIEDVPRCSGCGRTLPQASPPPAPAPRLVELWPRIQAELAAAVTELTYHLWLVDLEPAWYRRGVLFVRAPKEKVGLVAERYVRILEQAVSAIAKQPLEVQVVGEDWRP